MIYYCLHHQRNPFCQIRRFIESIAQNGLKISPKNVNMFRKELQYMGNAIFIEDKRVCVKPLRSRLEAI